MNYYIEIKNFEGIPLAGTVFLYKQDNQLGAWSIAPDGTTLTDEDIAGADHFRITAEGYGWYGTTNLYGTNVFTLDKLQKERTALWLTLGLAGGFVLFKLVKFKL